MVNFSNSEGFVNQDGFKKPKPSPTFPVATQATQVFRNQDGFKKPKPSPTFPTTTTTQVFKNQHGNFRPRGVRGGGAAGGSGYQPTPRAWIRDTIVSKGDTTIRMRANDNQ